MDGWMDGWMDTANINHKRHENPFSPPNYNIHKNCKFEKNLNTVFYLNNIDSALEPIYNWSKNLLLLPWILKLIVDIVNDSTSLI